jgi:hypothetical protein
LFAGWLDILDKRPGRDVFYCARICGVEGINVHFFCGLHRFQIPGESWN